MRDAEAGEAGTKRQRAADRSRGAILDAAERLFAEKGYENTSLKEIGEEAGLSRGTPAYFFGSKEGLYQAVVERMADDVRDFVKQPHSGPVSGERGNDVAAAMARAIGGYVDFLAARPNFVSLVEREVLDAHRLSQREPGLASLAGVLGDPGAGLLAEGLRRGPFREDVDPKQLAISIIALCFFPFAHADGLLKKQLGLDPYDADFIEERKRHVVNLLMHGILAREGSESSGPLAAREQGEHERPEE